MKSPARNCRTTSDLSLDMTSASMIREYQYTSCYHDRNAVARVSRDTQTPRAARARVLEPLVEDKPMIIPGNLILQHINDRCGSNPRTTFVDARMHGSCLISLNLSLDVPMACQTMGWWFSFQSRYREARNLAAFL